MKALRPLRARLPLRTTRSNRATAPTVRSAVSGHRLSDLGIRRTGTSLALGTSATKHEAILRDRCVDLLICGRPTRLRGMLHQVTAYSFSHSLRGWRNTNHIRIVRWINHWITTQGLHLETQSGNSISQSATILFGFHQSLSRHPQRNKNSDYKDYGGKSTYRITRTLQLSTFQFRERLVQNGEELLQRVRVRRFICWQGQDALP